MVSLAPDADPVRSRIDPWTRREVIAWAPGQCLDGWAVSCAHGFTIACVSRAEAMRRLDSTGWCPGCVAAARRAA